MSESPYYIFYYKDSGLSYDWFIGVLNDKLKQTNPKDMLVGNAFMQVYFKMLINMKINKDLIRVTYMNNYDGSHTLFVNELKDVLNTNTLNG